MINKDVIIVLGGGINADGSLKRPSQCRVEHAAMLYHQGVAPNIIVSSKWSSLLQFQPPCTIAAAMQTELLKLEIPAETIILEDQSGDTLSNIYYSKLLLKTRNWHNILIVTSPFQQPRAAYLCQKILGNNYKIDFSLAENGLDIEDLKIQMQLEEDLLQAFLETFNNFTDGDDQIFGEVLKNPQAYAEVPEFKKLQQLLMTSCSPFHRA